MALTTPLFRVFFRPHDCPLLMSAARDFTSASRLAGSMCSCWSPIVTVDTRTYRRHSDKGFDFKWCACGRQFCTTAHHAPTLAYVPPAGPPLKKTARCECSSSPAAVAQAVAEGEMVVERPRTESQPTAFPPPQRLKRWLALARKLGSIFS